MSEREKMVSIIVPVYNVEKYLDKCIQSIMNQTYFDFEVLLIDDGSEDSSGSICDLWAKEDSRILVFHKENGGLSDARNYGIARANGEYITFIDSDDVVGKDYLKILMNLILEYGAQIACVSALSMSENMKVEHDMNIKNGCLDTEEALKYACIRKYFGVSAWGKLYKSTLFSNLRYPKGRIYEDLLTTPYLIASSDSVAYSSSKQYFWIQRKGSITHTIHSKKEMALHLKGLEELVEFIDKHYRKIHMAAICRYVDDSFGSIIHKLVYSEEYYERIDYVIACAKSYWKGGLKSRYIRMSRKIEIILMMISSRLYKVIFMSRVKIKKFFSC